MGIFSRRKQQGWTSLEWDGGEVLYAQVEPRGAKLAVTACGAMMLDLKSPAAVKEFSSLLGLESRHVVAVLGRAEYQLLQIDAIKVPPQELKQAARWSIKDLLDYPVTNATVDVLDIPADPGNPARPHFMYAIAARNEAVRARVEALVEQASTGLEAIDIPETAQRNIAARLEQPGRGVAMLTFNREGGLLTLTAGGELYHARQIDVTIEQLQLADEERRSHVYERVGLDLQRSLDNFERQFPYVTVSRLLLAPFPMRDSFQDFLKSYLYLQVESFELSDVFDLEAVPQMADVALQARLFIVLGAALREEIA
jgi:MSHA biogenesis protein MshI